MSGDATIPPHNATAVPVARNGGAERITDMIASTPRITDAQTSEVRRMVLSGSGHDTPADAAGDSLEGLAAHRRGTGRERLAALTQVDLIPGVNMLDQDDML